MCEDLRHWRSSGKGFPKATSLLEKSFFAVLSLDFFMFCLLGTGCVHNAKPQNSISSKWPDLNLAIEVKRALWKLMQSESDEEKEKNYSLSFFLLN